MRPCSEGYRTLWPQDTSAPVPKCFVAEVSGSCSEFSSFLFGSEADQRARPSPLPTTVFINVACKVGCERELSRCGGPVMDDRGLDGVGARLID